MWAEPPQIRIAVLISGSGSNLQAIIDACESGQIPATIGLVLSNQSEAFGLTRAKQAGIDTQVLDHRDYPNRDAYDAAIQHALAHHEIDFVVLAGFMRILTAGFVDAWAGKMLNIHPSLLPKYPGLHTHERALESGDNRHGATVHFVTADLDLGPAIIQGSLAIEQSDTAERLAKRVLEQIEHQIYPIAVKWLCEGRISLSEGIALLDREPLPAGGLQWEV